MSFQSRIYFLVKKCRIKVEKIKSGMNIMLWKQAETWNLMASCHHLSKKITQQWQILIFWAWFDYEFINFLCWQLFPCLSLFGNDFNFVFVRMCSMLIKNEAKNASSILSHCNHWKRRVKWSAPPRQRNLNSILIKWGVLFQKWAMKIELIILLWWLIASSSVTSNRWNA